MVNLVRSRCHPFFFHRRSSELQRAGSGLLDKVISDTRSLKQIPLTEFSSDKDSSTCSFKYRDSPWQFGKSICEGLGVHLDIGILRNNTLDNLCVIIRMGEGVVSGLYSILRLHRNASLQRVCQLKNRMLFLTCFDLNCFFGKIAEVKILPYFDVYGKLIFKRTEYGKS